METIISVLAVLVLVLALALAWVMTLFCLPGNWLMVLASAVYAFLVPADWRVDIGWLVVGLIAAVAVIGEVLEFAAVVFGTTRAGGSKRSAALALCGSIGGGMIGAIVGLPIPIVGSVIAMLLFAAAGATAGAMIGEEWKGRSRDESWQVGKAAFWGRLLGTLGKVGAGSVIVVLVIAALIVR